MHTALIKKSIGPLLAALGLALSATGSAAAEGTACQAAPPAPSGHILARIDAVDGKGSVTVRFGSEVSGKRRPKAGDDAYLLDCAGHRVGGGGDSKVSSVSGSTANLVIALPPSGLVGRYVAIDSGYDSEAPLRDGEVRAPSGYTRARVLDVSVVQSGGVRVMLSNGPAQGVMPGAKGYLVNAKGEPVRNGAFTVQHAFSHRASRAVLPAASVDWVNAHLDVFVEVSERKCQVPSGVDPSAADLAAAAKGDAPAGWLAMPVNEDRSRWPAVKLGKGAKDGVLPGKAWVIVGGPAPVYLPANITDVGLGDASLTLAVPNPDAVRRVPLRVLVNASAACK